MARRFLYIVAVLIALFVAVQLVFTFYAEELSEWQFVPKGAYRERPALAPGSYDDPAMWLARPGLKPQADPAQWLPAGVRRPAAPLPIAVFFIHPTSHAEASDWNAEIRDEAAGKGAALFVKAMASPFNAAAEVWAPRYRQATVGAFLTDKPEAARALDLAYRDVLAAFDTFLRTVPADRPIALAGHSQGAFLLRRLMAERVAGTPLAGRVVAAYIAGWPVSLEHDLPKLGLPACTAPDQPGCVMSWLSVADPADTAMLLKAYARHPGLDGRPEGGSAFLCSNPLTGTANGGAEAARNLGSLVPDFASTGDPSSGELKPGVVPAGCGADHFLHIGPPPKLPLSAWVLPGNNYHIYDIPLFWANLRADFERRSAAWLKAH